MITRVALIVAGVAVLTFGGFLLWENIPRETYLNLGIWLAAGVILHDVVLAGLVAGGGWFISRYAPDRYRPYIQSGAIIAGTVIIMAIPVLIAGGRREANPSLLPLNYWLNLVIVVLTIAIITAIVAVVDTRRRSNAEGREDAAV